jgi:3-hydroxyisobutyrate dehydrogenase-like beta-hydroxyacid dehydrogenase
MRIGFLGLGIMGRGMVSNLLRHNYDVVVWNRTQTVAEAAFPNIVRCESPAALAGLADVIICCVSGPTAVDQILYAHDGVCAAATRGKIYIECSTIGPEQASTNETRLQEQGVRLLAAPVTGSKLGAENGTLLFMSGGSAELSEQTRPILLSMGERVIHCGSVAQAFVVKLANNTLVSFMLQGLCEGALALDKDQVPLQTWLEVVGHSLLGSKFYAFKGQALANRDFSTHFALELLLKDQNLMLNHVERGGMRLPALRAIRDVFQEAMHQGLGSDDMLGVIRCLEKRQSDRSAKPAIEDGD